MKKALIVGVSGQDGAYLAQLLVQKGYCVYGTSRNPGARPFEALRELGLLGNIELLPANPSDFRSVLGALSRVKPDEVYNLAGQSSVAASFDQPAETIQSLASGTLHILEAIRLLGAPIRFFNAGSIECFGNTRRVVTEGSPLRPVSPYGVGKAAAHLEVSGYRQSYGLFACTGILSNHESPLRSERFVTQKVVSAAWRISRGSGETLSLGSLDIARDWGWAEEYVAAMWLMLQQSQPADYVIATGATHTLRELVELAFQLCGLDWTAHTQVHPGLARPSDILECKADPSKARREMHWHAQATMPEVICRMVAAQQARSAESGGNPSCCAVPALATPPTSGCSAGPE